MKLHLEDVRSRTDPISSEGGIVILVMSLDYFLPLRVPFTKNSYVRQFQ